MKEGCDLCKRMRVIVLRTGVRVARWMVEIGSGAIGRRDDGGALMEMNFVER